MDNHKKWDFLAFRAAVDNAALQRNTTKEAIFCELASLVNISSRSLKEYQTPRASPSPQIARNLSNYFCKDFESDSSLSNQNTLSQWVLYDTLLSISRVLEDIGDEEAYKALILKLELAALVLPEETLNQLKTFMKNTIEPLVVTEEAFSPCSEEGVVGSTTSEGVFVVEDTPLFFERFFQILKAAQAEFAVLKESLVPLLVS